MTISAKTLPVFLLVVLTLLLSACAGDVELQQDGSGSDAPLPSPCVGAPGSPCHLLPYQGPGFAWERV